MDNQKLNEFELIKEAMLSLNKSREVFNKSESFMHVTDCIALTLLALVAIQISKENKNNGNC